MHRRFAAAVVVVAGLAITSPLLAEGRPPGCDLAGTWYGGSVVAYHMTIVPTRVPDRYTVSFQGMYKNSVMNTAFTGELARKQGRYQGSFLQLTTGDPAFLNPPPIGKLPDIRVGWTSMKLVDCDTIENVIPFYGTYFGSTIWQPGIVWLDQGKVPLVDPPDVDILALLGGKAVVETYHRLLKTINPDLLYEP